MIEPVFLTNYSQELNHAEIIAIAELLKKRPYHHKPYSDEFLEDINDGTKKIISRAVVFYLFSF